MSTIAQRLSNVRERIETAAARRGAGPPVTLIGVSKKHPPEAIAEACDAGLSDFGENYAQELRDKRGAIERPQLRWHFIGPVQTNKAKLVVGIALVHTVDRPKLLRALEAKAAAAGVVQDVLVQVNVAQEAQKSGASEADVPALLDQFAELEHVRCRGLMVIPPLAGPEATRPHFRRLAQLRDQWSARARPGVDLVELSMGMSSDFEVAVEEGATLIRVGTAIFGPRPA